MARPFAAISRHSAAVWQTRFRAARVPIRVSVLQMIFPSTGAGVAADWNDIRIGFVGQSGSILLDNQHYGDAGIEAIRFADGTVWTHAQIMARYVLDQQTGAADTIHGSNFNDVAQAGAGNDLVVSGGGDDIVAGGPGNDNLQGWVGADSYLYDAGDGDDVILDNQHGDGAATDTIVFGAGIAPGSLTFSRVAADWNDIRIGFAGQAGSILLDNQHYGDAGIEAVRFDDGTVWSQAELMAHYVAGQQTSGDDNINGSHFADTVSAGAGDDIVVMGAGSDLIRGGAGNDRLEGNEDGDTYHYDVGDGHDVVFDYKGTRNNVLQLGEGIALDELLVSRPQGDSGSLRISFKTLAGSVTLLNQSWGDAGVETLRFHNGTVLSEAALLQLLGAATNGNDSLAGTSGADSVWALEGADTVSGLAGADLLAGGEGADIFRFDSGGVGLGTGADRIADFVAGSDRIDLSAIDADGALAGDQAFAFIGSAAFSSVAGELRYAFDGVDTVLEADSNGDGAADFQIVLSGNVAPLAADFTL